MGCDRRYVEIGVPCRFCILFDFLVNWRTGSLQGVVHKLYHFGQQVLLCSTRSLPQDCRSLLNLLLLDATGLSAVFPSTRQGMHPAVALETSTLPQMSLVQYSSWCRISPKLSASRTSWCNRTRCGGRTCRNKRRYVYIAAGRDMDTTLSSSFWSCILFAIVEQLKKPKFSVQQVELKWLILNKWRSLFHSSRVKFPLLSTCLRVGVKLTDLNFGVQIDPVKQPIQSNFAVSWNMSHCWISTFDNHFDYRLAVLKGIQHGTRTRIRCIWWNVINVCWNDVGVLDWDGVMHVWLNNCRRVSPWSWVHLFCSVRNEILQHQIPESESGNTVGA